MSARILFIEDELAFAIGVRDRLLAEGYTVTLVQNGYDGYQKARQGSFDLVLLDVMLPGKSGFDICRDLRRDGVGTPLLMLTARGEVTDRIVGLKLGADDYVLKPCDVSELLARVEALLRRASGSPARSNDVYEFGVIRVDFKQNEMFRDGEPVPLSRGEWRLLRYLLDHTGATISRNELLDKVWGLSTETMSRTVDVHVASLRKKIEPDPRYPQFLVTVKGIGYKLSV